MSEVSRTYLTCQISSMQRHFTQSSEVSDIICKYLRKYKYESYFSPLLCHFFRDFRSFRVPSIVAFSVISGLSV